MRILCGRQGGMKSDVGVTVRHCMPEEILHHAVIFILPRAIVSMQVCIFIAKAVMFKNSVSD